MLKRKQPDSGEVTESVIVRVLVFWRQAENPSILPPTAPSSLLSGLVLFHHPIKSPIDRQQFEETVRTLNNLYAEAEKLGGQSYLEGCLACLTAYTIFLCMETHYEKAVAALGKRGAAPGKKGAIAPAKKAKTSKNAKEKEEEKEDCDNEEEDEKFEPKVIKAVAAAPASKNKDSDEEDVDEGDNSEEAVETNQPMERNLL
ncbi:Golgin subfamily A member 7 [Fukomys damarensis]|uniref:Golgin subfamily A member 7 n=1 Tax=Fukomys damarensis TaxID=885580 RepID=A0A091DZB3_FUKDA|nr:Golgin subfamily A member 7 [Fukomys damarensis]